MSLFDLASKIAILLSLTPAVRTDSAPGDAVDTDGFHSVAVEYVAGGYTNGSFTGSLLEGDTADGAFTPVAEGDIQGELPTVASGDDDHKAYWVGYKGHKRFLKAGWAQTASPAPGTGMICAASVVLGHPRLAPTQ